MHLSLPSQTRDRECRMPRTEKPMRHLSRLVSFLIGSFTIAQGPCSFTVNAPAFVVACPCGGDASTHTPGPWLDFVGTGRIGTMQRFEMNYPAVCDDQASGYLIIGTPLAGGLSIPNGLVVCYASMAPVSHLVVDPLYVQSLGAFRPNLGPCRRFYPYFLFVPNATDLVGLAVHAQFFENLVHGGSNVPWYPFAASAVIGFSVTH